MRIAYNPEETNIQAISALNIHGPIRLEIYTHFRWFSHWPICFRVGVEGRAHLTTMKIERASNSHSFMY